MAPWFWRLGIKSCHDSNERWSVWKRLIGFALATVKALAKIVEERKERPEKDCQRITKRNQGFQETKRINRKDKTILGGR